MVCGAPNSIKSRHKVVSYLCPPLPLTPPFPGSCEPTCAQEVSSHLKLIVVPECPLLFCYCREQNRQCTLCVCSLTECGHLCHAKGEHFHAFKDWQDSQSLLKCTILRSCKMPEQIKQIDSEVVVGVPYLCITFNHQLILYQLPPSNTALSCEWIDRPVIHESQCKILFSKISPYIPRQVLVLTEGGGLYIYQHGLGMAVIRDGEAVGHTHFCMFGAHPRHVLWIEGGRLFSADLRTAELPLSQSVASVKGIEGIAFAIIQDSVRQPFHLFVATRSHLMLIDVRQPTEPLWTVLHYLAQAPVSITLLHANNGTTCLVLICSSDQSVLFCCNSPFFSVLSLFPPHTVCSLRDLVQCLKRSGLYALACSQLNHFTSIKGSALLNSTHDTYGVLILTELGDVFHQYWHYSHTCECESVNLTECQYMGLSLWMHEAHALRSESHPQYDGKFLSGTVKDMSYIAKYLVSEKESAQSSLNNDDSDKCELDSLQCLYQLLVPTEDLDVAMVTEWGRGNMEELTTVCEVQNSSITSTPDTAEIKTSLKRRIGF